MWAAKLAGRTPVGTTELPTALTGDRVRGIVLGIDPSLRGTGIAVVEVRGPEQMQLLASRTLTLAASRYSMTQCLGMITAAVEQFAESHPLTHVAVEETIYVQNFRTAQILGAARGAAIGPLSMRGVPVFEYSPLRIKQAVSGFGRASKEQIVKQMQALLRLSRPLASDEADASAVAVCHALTWRGKLGPQ